MERLSRCLSLRRDVHSDDVFPLLEGPPPALLHVLVLHLDGLTEGILRRQHRLLVSFQGYHVVMSTEHRTDLFALLFVVCCLRCTGPR